MAGCTGLSGWIGQVGVKEEVLAQLLLIAEGALCKRACHNQEQDNCQGNCP
jgi:hypothetical protein